MGILFAWLVLVFCSVFPLILMTASGPSSFICFMKQWVIGRQHIYYTVRKHKITFSKGDLRYCPRNLRRLELEEMEKKNTVYVSQRLSDGNITACGW